MDALNSEHKLPRYLVVVMDKDIIQSINLFNYGAYQVIAETVNWLTRQIDITVRRKRLNITEKKPGAIANEYEPTIIYTMMVRRPQTYPMGSKMESICSLRTKFNNVLNEAAVRQDAKVLSIRSLSMLEHFDPCGNLSRKGKTAFWYEMDNLIDRFENDGLQLKPRPIASRNKRRQPSQFNE